MSYTNPFASAPNGPLGVPTLQSRCAGYVGDKIALIFTKDEIAMLRDGASLLEPVEEPANDLCRDLETMLDAALEIL